MKHVSRAIGLAGFCVLVAVALTGDAAYAQRDATVAVVRDGLIADYDPVELFKAEIDQLLGTRATVTFKDSPAFNANWDPARYEQVVRAAMADPEVDYVVGVGPFVTRIAADPGFPLAKPFISAYVQRTPLFGIPYTDAGSRKDNFTFIIIPRGVERDLSALKELDVFDRVTILVGEEFLTLVEDLDQAKAWAKQELDIEFEVVGVGKDVRSAVAGLPDDTRVVYIGRTPRLARLERGDLIDALNERGVATFSLIGHSDVRMGALAGLMPDLEEQVVRRVALNIAALMRGESPNDLPVVMTADTRLMINGATAAAIGFQPSFSMLALAEVLDVGALEGGAQPLDFSGALILAEERNIDLFVKDAGVEISYRDKQIARSPLLPQLNADAGFLKAEPFFGDDGVFPREFANVGLRLSQMIYDDQSVSDFRSQGRLYEADVLDREVVRLDVMADTGTEFLRYVLSRLLVRVDADNVQLTADNLDLSKVRYDVGYSGQNEVFRWTAELANKRGSLLRSATNMEASRIAFNQIIGVEQSRRWLPQEVEVDPDVFFWLDGRLHTIYRNAAQRPKLREAMVQVAIDQAPELGFFQKALEAQDIQIGLATRRFFVPTFMLDFRYNYAAHWEPLPQGNLRDDSYRVQLSAVYPLFNGAARYQDRRKQLAQKTGLESERERARQFVELRARTAFVKVENSFPRINLAQIQSENAIKNLNVVQDKYSQGIVNVTDLLEAQNQAFTAQQNAAASVYEFLIDLVDLQRAVAWFEDEYSDAEVEDLVRRIQEIISQMN